MLSRMTAVRGTWDQAMTRVKDPLQRILRRIDPERRIEAYRVWRFWDEVVGDAIAARAQPTRVQDGILVVTVSSAPWMQELQFLKATILERLNARLGAPLLTDLFFVSGSVREAKPSPPAARSRVVAVPDLPQTGRPDIDAAMRRLARAFAHRHAREAPPESPRRRR